MIAAAAQFQRRPGLRAGTHMWTAPVPQEFFQGLIGSLTSICPACWCGWSTAGQDGFRDASSKQPGDLCRPMGPTECLAPRIDRSYHLIYSCSSGSAGRRHHQPADLLSDGGCIKHPPTIVTLARRQQLPGDAGNLVGERDRCKLGRFARQQRHQPGAGWPRPFLACWITAVAPDTSTLRNISSPARVILPSLVLPPVE